MLAGFFKGTENLKYFMIVNCDHTKKRETTVSLSKDFKTVHKMSKQTGKWENINIEDSTNNLSITLDAGSGELFKAVH